MCRWPLLVTPALGTIPDRPLIQIQGQQGSELVEYATLRRSCDQSEQQGFTADHDVTFVQAGTLGLAQACPPTIGEKLPGLPPRQVPISPVFPFRVSGNPSPRCRHLPFGKLFPHPSPLKVTTQFLSHEILYTPWGVMTVPFPLAPCVAGTTQLQSHSELSSPEGSGLRPPLLPCGLCQVSASMSAWIPNTCLQPGQPSGPEAQTCSRPLRLVSHSVSNLARPARGLPLCHCPPCPPHLVACQPGRSTFLPQS